MRLTRMGIAVVLVGLFATLGCGGGGGGDSGPETLLIGSTADLDGYVRSDGAAGTAGTSAPVLGDFDAVVSGLTCRQFFSFDLTAIPSGATILSAQLRLVQANVQGTPYATHGGVVLDHVDYGAALTAVAFAGGTLTSGVGTLSPDATLGPRTMDVRALVVADLLATRTRSQFRLRFSLLDSDLDSANDYVGFVPAEGTWGNPSDVPSLVIEYQR